MEMAGIFMTDVAAASFQTGQMWSYRTRPALADSRLIIGALLAFEAGPPIACCTVTGALQQLPDGRLERVTIPFLPMTVAALARTVTTIEGEASVAPAFAAHFASWHDDDRGLSYFTVPFEGSLDRMIALQMAEIAGDEAQT